ncbi:helix-turn-helix transcriptional regulator [Agrococcus sp. Marseille-P2731]|uniref:helix-turn-helix transcriptional regulator n=1 Tax=Agrococcus sp. Marseille-P2731 TaxID=1841862 RepID=UPI003FA413E1
MLITVTPTDVRTNESTRVRTDIFEKTPGILLNNREVAAMLDLSVKTVQRRRQRGTGPRAIQREGTVRYLVRDVPDWVKQGPGYAGPIAR